MLHRGVYSRSHKQAQVQPEILKLSVQMGEKHQHMQYALLFRPVRVEEMEGIVTTVFGMKMDNNVHGLHIHLF